MSSSPSACPSPNCSSMATSGIGKHPSSCLNNLSGKPSGVRKLAKSLLKNYSILIRKTDIFISTAQNLHTKSSFNLMFLPGYFLFTKFYHAGILANNTYFGQKAKKSTSTDAELFS